MTKDQALKKLVESIKIKYSKWDDKDFEILMNYKKDQEDLMLAFNLLVQICQETLKDK